MTVIHTSDVDLFSILDSTSHVAETLTFDDRTPSIVEILDDPSFDQSYCENVTVKTEEVTATSQQQHPTCPICGNQVSISPMLYAQLLRT
jgi:hypothetical protein